MSNCRYLGLDIGSRQIKSVAIDDDGGWEAAVIDTGSDPYARSVALLERFNVDKVVATGYGRHFAKDEIADSVITEIKAHAVGSRHLFPNCRTVIDIGGQDSKVILVDQAGGVEDFQMNDRCAAGTGKFLEVMAQTLGFSVASFGVEALKAPSSVKINSMCTVFAESEVVSLLATKTMPASIALGLHEAIADRIFGMVKRLGAVEEIIFSGGVAYNPCVKELLERRLGKSLSVAARPELTGAFGAALLARRLA